MSRFDSNPPTTTLNRCAKSGVTVIHAEIPESRSVSIGIYIRNGAANEADNEAGISHLLEHLVFKGAVSNGIELTEAMADLGAHINAYTTDEHTAFYVTCLPEVAVEALSLLFEIFIPKFSDDEIELERSVILEEMRQYRDDPSYEVHEKGLLFFAPNHPLSNPIIGTESSLRRMQRSHLEEFLRRQYSPTNLCISIAGRTSGLDLMRVIEERAYVFDSFSRVVNSTKPLPIKARHGIQRLRKRDMITSHLVGFWPGISEHDPRKFSLELWCDIIGTGSRFAWQLIEPGLVDSAGISCEPRMSTGYVMISAVGEPKQMTEVEKIVRTILTESLTKPVTSDELEQAKAMTAFSLASMHETPAECMNANGEHWLTHGEIYPLAAELRAFADVSLESVNQFSGKFLLDDAALTFLTPA